MFVILVWNRFRQEWRRSFGRCGLFCLWPVMFPTEHKVRSFLFFHRFHQIKLKTFLNNSNVSQIMCKVCVYPVCVFTPGEKACHYLHKGWATCELTGWCCLTENMLRVYHRWSFFVCLFYFIYSFNYMCSKYALLKKNKTTVGCQTGAIVFVTKRTKLSFF